MIRLSPRNFAPLALGLLLGACLSAAAAEPPASRPKEPSMSEKRLPPPSPEEIAKLPPDGGPQYNRLVFESSPYLLQHCRNPVDWYPWGEAAFARAKAENKPVFLSIG